MLRVHIYRQTRKVILHLFQLTLRTRGPTKVTELPKNTKHRGKCNLTDSASQALVGARAKVNILAHVAVETDCFRVWEYSCIVASSDLEHTYC